MVRERLVDLRSVKVKRISSKEPYEEDDVSPLSAAAGRKEYLKGFARALLDRFGTLALPELEAEQEGKGSEAGTGAVTARDMAKLARDKSPERALQLMQKSIQ